MMRRHAAWVLIVAFLLPLATLGTERLGRDVVPTFQAIKLIIDARKADYAGSAQIELGVRRATKAFRFHAKGPKLSRLVLRDATGTLAITHQSREGGIVEVSTKKLLAPGAYKLEIDFSNDFNTRADALFKVEVRGESYAFTQFEPDAAREAFPCWDEPAFKIPYQMTLVVPKEHVAISNTPVLKETQENGLRTVVFQKTRPLPSYLLAVATGPLETVPVPGMSVPGRVVTVKGQSHLAGEAVKMAPPILGALEKYFGRAYPYEKLDLIAIPGFGGAMENVGAVTFQDNLLLLDSKTATAAQRNGLAATMAHEFAHMWFGNLVTMEWWDDLWLNESFATWMGDKIAHRVYRHLEIDLDEIRYADFAMRTDARLSTRAIRRPVRPIDNLNQAFDELTYPKGGRVLRMFEQWIGPSRFRQGVRQYLRTHQWGNATASDLWRALSRVAGGRNVGAAMSSFFDQPGLPLVTVELLPQGQVRLSQQRFLNYGVKESAAARWQVPVTLKFADGSGAKKQSAFLSDARQVIRLGPVGEGAWIYPNAAESGFYRWKVEPEALLALARNSARILDPRERIGFLANISALLDAGAIEGPDYLRAVGLFAEDPHPLVLRGLLDAMTKVRAAFVATEQERDFAAYLRKILAPAASRIGWSRVEGEPEAASLLRSDLMLWMARDARDSKTLEQAEAMARAYLADASSIDPSLASTVLRLAAMHGDSSLFETYRQRFENASVPSDRDHYLGALGAFRSPELVEKALRYALDGPLRPNEIFVIPGVVRENRGLEDLSVEWIGRNYGAIVKRIPPFAARFLPYLARGCSTKRLEAAEAIFAQASDRIPGIEKELAKLKEMVSDCVSLREREGSAVAGYLRQFAQ